MTFLLDTKRTIEFVWMRLSAVGQFKLETNFVSTF